MRKILVRKIDTRGYEDSYEDTIVFARSIQEYIDEIYEMEPYHTVKKEGDKFVYTVLMEDNWTVDYVLHMRYLDEA